jgi:uncharacterized short protein YbdD (DUF466 family)
MIVVRSQPLARAAGWVCWVRWYLRELTGETAYERYLEHRAASHDGTGEPMSRREFERRRAERSAQPGNRCC